MKAALTPMYDEGEEQHVPHNYNPERKPLVKDALESSVKQLALLNRFLPENVQGRTRDTNQLEDHAEISLLCDCPDIVPSQQAQFRKLAAILTDDEGQVPRPLAALKVSPEMPQQTLLPCCFLSGASALSAVALRVEPGDKVLDLCAGVGARALVLASMLFAPKGQERPVGAASDPASVLEMAGAEAGLLGPPSAAAWASGGGRLVVNEPNKAKVGTLEQVLGSFLPPDMLSKQGCVSLTKVEVSEKTPLALQRQGPFDKVVVEPPCTPSRRKGQGPEKQDVEDKDSAIGQRAEQAEAILRSSSTLVRPGGILVYVTTSLQKRDNDEVVRKFLKRAQGDFSLIPGSDEWPIEDAVKTEYGTTILPDQGTNHGPLYFAKLRRKQG
jgi:16S rRNA C967 or C1407 C5-methylase (RsmB/RsmF family)